MPDLTLEQQVAVEKVVKILRLAAKNPNENEAAAAAAKAQELLAQYNLDMTVIEANSGASSGKREDAKTKGGLYVYQRELWKAVADLNFCMYFNLYTRDPDKISRRKDRYTGMVVKSKGGWKFEHRLVGRVVNTTATRTMAQYLEQTIERLTREKVNNDPKEFFTRWAMGFREGLADAIEDKLYERRKHLLAAEERKEQEARKAAAKAEAAGHSISTTLTLADVAKSEEQANYDFIHGEGAWAKREARRARNDAEWEKQQQAIAADEAKAEAEYTMWAKANPEEARKSEEAERKKDERNARRRTGSWRSARPSAREERRDSGAFASGREAGRKVGIDPQTDTKATQGRLA